MFKNYDAADARPPGSRFLTGRLPECPCSSRIY